jgi:hypothetical protein
MAPTAELSLTWDRMGNSHKNLLIWNQLLRFYVKLSSAVAAILVRGLKCWTQYWKGTTQGSFQQSLVEIGSVVSEEIFLNFISPFFCF